jgi:ligand-binding sensor domain-containing protein
LYAQELEITTYTANEGLSQNSVKDVIEDKNGRLWIATAQGVNTFDGSEFVNYVSGQPNSLGMINQSVEKLAVDSKGNIWLAGNNGIEKYNPRSFKFSTELAIPLGEISSFEIDEVNNYIEYSFLGNKFTYSLKNKKWLNNKKFSIPTNQFSQEFNPKGKIFGQGKWLDIQIEKNRVKLQYQGESIVSTINLSPSFQYLNVVYQPQWKQFILTLTNKEETLITILNQKLEHIKIPSKTLAKFNASYIKNITAIGNKVWIGTEGHGLIKLSYTQMLMHCSPIPALGIIKNIISKDSLLYIVSVDQGILVFNKNTHQFISNSKINSQLLGKGQFGGFNSIEKTNRPYEFMVYSNNLFGLWNSQNQSYQDLNPHLNQFNFKANMAYYYQLAKSHQNHYLIANNNELTSFDLINNNIRNIGKKYRFHSKITFLKSINKNLAIIGTESGAYTFNLQSGLFKFWQGTQRHLIKHVMFHQGHWWISSSNGLLKYSKGSLVKYTKANGLSDNYVYASIAKQGKIWLSTNKGLNSIDMNTGQIQVFDVNNGLCGNEFNSFSFYDNGDTLYFGCIGGLVSFEPRKFNENKKRNTIQLNSIWVNDNTNQNRANDLSSSLIFGPNENRLTINFSTNNLNASLAETYYYKLVGKNENWVNNGSRRDIRFGNLSAGH